MSFSNEELEHYSRHILVRDFGGQAQAKLKASKVAIIGLGGIGSPVALYLAAAGIGHMVLFEDDVVSASNLQRQVLYTHREIGKSKSKLAAEKLRALNPYIELELAGRFEDELPDCNLVIDGSDRLETRHKVNRAAALKSIPLLAASLGQWEGQIALFHPHIERGCYHCLYPEGTDAAAIPNCSEAGVIGPIAGMIGTMAAVEALKILAGIKPMEAGKMRLIDGLYNEQREIKIRPNADCPICGRGE